MYCNISKCKVTAADVAEAYDEAVCWEVCYVVSGSCHSRSHLNPINCLSLLELLWSVSCHDWNANWKMKGPVQR